MFPSRLHNLRTVIIRQHHALYLITCKCCWKQKWLPLLDVNDFAWKRCIDDLIIFTSAENSQTKDHLPTGMSPQGTSFCWNRTGVVKMWAAKIWLSSPHCDIFSFGWTQSPHTTNQTSLYVHTQLSFIYRVFEEPCLQMHWNYRQNSSFYLYTWGAAQSGVFEYFSFFFWS